MMQYAGPIFCTGYFWASFLFRVDFTRVCHGARRMFKRKSAWGLRAGFGWVAYAFVAVCCPAAPVTHGTRLKDLISIEGVRQNQLVGYGLVVGLNGTGDRQQTLFPAQSLVNLLQKMGVSTSATLITVKNTAAVIVTATLPPYGQPGSQLDASVAAIGDATNLQGGLLVLTTLRGINGQVYATVQGPVVTAGFVAGRSSNSTTVNHPTAGRIPNGVTIEKAAPSVPDWRRGQAAIKRSRFRNVGAH